MTTKYYQKFKKRPRQEARVRFKIFLKEKKTKGIKIFLKKTAESLKFLTNGN